MSNPLAIAAVTAALRRRIGDGLLAGLPAALPAEFDINSARITVSTPDRARSDNKKVNQVNLHLYRVEPSAALRNHDFPPPVGGGPGPLALVLHYLVTAYAAGDDETPSHVMLAQALRVVHERPFIAPAELRGALAGADPAFDFETVRLAPTTLSVEEFNRLWSLYQTPARVSAAFSASLVLIETRTPKSTPLPVLTRNLEVRPDIFQYPTIDAIELPQGRSFALLGDTVTLRGHRLAAPQVRVRLTHPRFAPIDLTPASASDTAITLTLPADPKALPAGPYALTVRLINGTTERTTDVQTLTLAPDITAGIPGSLTRAGDGSVSLTLTFRPEVRQGQRLSLLFGDREIAPPPPPPPAPGPPPPPPPPSFATQQFTISAVPPGTYLVRLRVDGVDSDVLDRNLPAPTFAANRRTTVP